MPEFTLNLVSAPFDLGYTLESGQVFRWAQKGEWWYGIIGRGVVKVRQEGNALVCSTSSGTLDHQFIRNFFGLDDDLPRIFQSIMKDKYVTEAVQSFYGLRIMRQDVWDCLLSFVVATNTSIPNITRMISSVCAKYGEEVAFEGSSYSLFPTSERLADASVDDLRACGLGYRAKFVKSVAEAVSHRTIDLEELRFHDYDRAKESLLQDLFGKKTLLGIGPKVADCVLLFSCNKTSAFPIDVWIAKVLVEYYADRLDEGLIQKLSSKVSRKSTLSSQSYERLASTMRSYFGDYAGYAQQYLYHYTRMAGR